MLSKETGIEQEIYWEATYISGSNKIQLNEDITVVLSYEVDIGLFGNFSSSGAISAAKQAAQQ